MIVLHVCTYASNPTLATHGLGVFGSSRTWILFGAAISLRQPAYVNDCLNCKQIITSGIRNTDERIRALNCTCCALISILYFNTGAHTFGKCRRVDASDEPPCIPAVDTHSRIDSRRALSRRN